MTFKKILQYFSVIGSLASIISLVIIFWPKNDNIKLLVNTISKEKLTINSDQTEPDLAVNYKYKGLEIKNLWKYNVQLKNISDLTILGTGNRKNILFDDLTLLLKDEYEVLDIKTVKENFYNRVIIDSNKIKISFKQWRPKEELEYSLYIKSSNLQPSEIIFSTPNIRQIVDGDLDFEFSNLEDEKEYKILSFLPEKVELISYVITTVFISILVFIITFILIMYPIASITTIRWKKKYYEDYKILVNELFSEDETIKEQLIDDPNRAPISFWDKFEGDEFPHLFFQMDIDVEDTNINERIMFLVLLIIIDFSLFVSIFRLIDIIG